MSDGSLDYRFKIDVPTGSITAGTKAVDGLDHALKKLGGDAKVEQLEKQLRKLQQPGKIKALETEIANFGKSTHGHFAGVGHSIENAQLKLHHLLEFTGAMLAFEAVEKVAHAVVHLGEEAIAAAAAGERMDLAFKLSLGDHGGEEIVEFLERITGKVEFTDDQLKGWGKQLINAGVAAEELDKFMAAALDTAAKAPDKMEGMGSAIGALSKASLSGAVDMRSLRALSIGVEQLKVLPKFANLSLAQLKKEMTNGKLTKEDLLAAIAGPDKILGDLGLQAGKTMEARMLHLKNIPEEIFQRLRKTEAFDRLSGAIGRVLEKLDPEGPFGDKIFGALERLFGKLADTVDEIDFDSIAATITDDVVPAIETMLGAIKPTIEAVQQVIRGFREMHDMAFGAKPKNAALDEFDRRMKAGPLDEGPTFLQKGKDLGGGVRLFKGKMRMAGEQAADGMRSGIGKSRSRVADEAAAMGGDAIDATKKKLDAHSPSVVFEDIGGMAAAGFAQGVRGGSRDVDRAIDDMVRAPRQAPAASSGGGGISLVIERVEVNAGGSSPAQAEEAARAFTTTLRPLIIELLEQVADEMGARA